MDEEDYEDQTSPSTVLRKLTETYKDRIIIPTQEELLYKICEKHGIDIGKEFMELIEDHLKKQEKCVHHFKPLDRTYHECYCVHCNLLTYCNSCYSIANKRDTFEHRYGFDRNYVEKECLECHKQVSYTTCKGCKNATCWCSCRYGCSCWN